MRSKRRKESACPERGFEPSAPGGRCSEGRIGRNREYCKQQRSKTTIFQPALWMRVQRADGGVASGLLLFTATPQSIRLAAYCQLPGRGAFLGALYKLLHSLGGPPMTAPTLHIINLWQKHGDAQRPPQLYNLFRSPAARRISHGAAIFHIAQAVIICQTGDIQLMPNVN